jgi:MFS family permease
MAEIQNKIRLAWIMCFLAATFYCYEFLLRVLPAVIVPEMMTMLNIGAAQVGLISSFYFMSYTPLQIFVGTIMDHFGVRWPLTLATISCAIGMYIFSIPTLTNAKLGMFLVGAGSAFAFVGVLKIAADWLPNKYFALVSGLTTTLGMLGATMGETTITVVINDYGVKNSMLGLSFIGLILTVTIFYSIKDKRIIATNNWWKEFLHLIHDLKNVAIKSQIWINGLIGMFLFAPTTTFAGLWGVPYLQMTKGVSAHEAGAIISSIFVGWIFGGPIAGLLSNHIKSRKKILCYGALISSLILFKIIYFPSESQSITILLMFLLGLFSGSEVLVFAVAHDMIEDKLAGTAVSLTNMIVMISGIMQYLVGLSLEYFANPFPQETLVKTYTEQDFQISFLIMPIGLILAFILSFLLNETYHLKDNEE